MDCGQFSATGWGRACDSDGVEGDVCCDVMWFINR